MGRKRSCLLPFGRGQDPISIKTWPSPIGMIVEIALVVPKHGVQEPLFASGQPATEKVVPSRAIERFDPPATTQLRSPSGTPAVQGHLFAYSKRQRELGIVDNSTSLP